MSKTRKPRNAERRSLEPGQSMKGKYLGSFETEGIDQTSGEVVERKIFKFEDLESGYVFTLGGSAGLKIAMQDAQVQEGETIEIVRKPNFENRKGNKQSAYDIFSI